jgi:hypothetical protein
MGAAALAVRKLLAASKNPRTVLGQMRPGPVAFHAAYEAVTVYRETLAHEEARRAGDVCRECGRVPNGTAGQLPMRITGNSRPLPMKR